MSYLLPLRSFGDFIIDCFVLNNASSLKLDTLALPSYLNGLRGCVNEERIFVVEYDLKVRSNILSFFTNKYFFTLENLKELNQLKSGIKNLSNVLSGNPFLEETDFRNGLLKNYLSLNGEIISSDKSLNVYESRWSCLSCEPFEYVSSLPIINPKELITFFPDSRLKRKEIDINTTKHIASFFKKRGIGFQIAVFAKPEARTYYNNFTDNTVLSYSNFTELQELIASSSFVLGCDSMPIHMAQLMRKPHFVIFNERINYRWLTPFAIKYKGYSLSSNFISFFESYYEEQGKHLWNFN